MRVCVSYYESVGIFLICLVHLGRECGVSAVRVRNMISFCVCYQGRDFIFIFFNVLKGEIKPFVFYKRL